MSFTSFFHSIKAFFQKVFGSANLGRTISATITIAAPLVESIVAMTAGEAAADEIKSVVNEVQSDLAAAAALATSVTPGAGETVPAQIGSILNGVKTNLASLLAAGHIKDTATVGKVTNIVNTVVNEIEAILSELPTVTAPTPTAAA